MTKVTRREAISTLTGTLLLVAVVHADTEIEDDPLTARESPFSSKKWAESADDPSVGSGADFDSLADRISAFFGNATGRYLADQVVDLDSAAPGWDTRERPIYEQFSAIFKGAPELDAVLTSGVRMVVRYKSSYKAAVFLDSGGSIAAAALTFDYCPPGGVNQQIAGGRAIHTDCVWPFSAVLFYRTKAPDPVMVAAFRSYLTSLRMPTEQAQAARMSPDGKVRIMVLGQHID